MARFNCRITSLVKNHLCKRLWNCECKFEQPQQERDAVLMLLQRPYDVVFLLGLDNAKNNTERKRITIFTGGLFDADNFRFCHEIRI